MSYWGTKCNDCWKRNLRPSLHWCLTLLLPKSLTSLIFESLTPLSSESSTPLSSESSTPLSFESSTPLMFESSTPHPRLSWCSSNPLLTFLVLSSVLIGSLFKDQTYWTFLAVSILLNFLLAIDDFLLLNMLTSKKTYRSNVRE